MSTEYDISPERAIDLLRSAAQPLRIELVAVAAAGGRVLRADQVSLVDRPAADDSALDGYACRVADTTSATDSKPVVLEVIGEAPAGAPFSGRLGHGQAVQIATGGLLPAGADGVIGVEHVAVDGGRVALSRPASAAAVRPRAQDLRAGLPYLRAGIPLASASVGLAAAMGHGEVPVSRRPRIAIITTGNEVVAPGQPVSGGQLYDANGASLATAARRAGCEVVAAEYVADETAALQAAFAAHCDAVDPPDLIITSGGVSRGERDVVRDVLLGEDELMFWRVMVRPAGPTMFGRFRGVAVLGLPGNPVSSLVGFLLFGRAFIDSALCSSAPLPFYDRLSARLAGEFRPQVKTVLHRAHLTASEGVLEARPFSNQSSGVLRSLVEADALVVTPPSRSNKVLGAAVYGEVIDLRKHL